MLLRIFGVDRAGVEQIRLPEYRTARFKSSSIEIVCGNMVRGRWDKGNCNLGVTGIGAGLVRYALRLPDSTLSFGEEFPRLIAADF